MLLTKRNRVTPTERLSAAKAALQLFINHPLFLASQQVACYFATGNEFDCTLFINAIWGAKKNCFLPVLSEQQSLTFSAYHPHDILCSNRYNILEPENKTHFPIEELDLVFVPLVGFDLQGNRLGMGGGYYDRTFSHLQDKKKPYLIGLAYECQYVPEVPEEPFDVPLDAVLTEDKLYTFPRQSLSRN
jgi:5-formyltetrahydrofolate cyclo-ligase